MKEYLKTLDYWTACDAYKWRTKMGEVGENFKRKCGTDPQCPVSGCTEIDSQQHLGVCQIVNIQGVSTNTVICLEKKPQK